MESSGRFCAARLSNAGFSVLACHCWLNWLRRDSSERAKHELLPAEKERTKRESELNYCARCCCANKTRREGSPKRARRRNRLPVRVASPREGSFFCFCLFFDSQSSSLAQSSPNSQAPSLAVCFCRKNSQPVVSKLERSSIKIARRLRRRRRRRRRFAQLMAQLATRGCVGLKANKFAREPFARSLNSIQFNVSWRRDSRVLNDSS